MTKDETLKKALNDLIAEYHMETSSFAKRVDEIFEQALAAQPAHVKVWEAEGYDSLMQEMQMVKARNIRQHAEIERLKAAQPAPVQLMAHIVGEIDHTGKVWKPVQPAPVQEPVATVTSESGNPDVTMSWWHEPPLPVGT